ncbi:unnamed protein product [Owenia fusiformis]|uniref:Uncharacterized protein n=1 Tax=Owenia fusiformis TaxID=6347 RepID=A0A8S4Q8S6_OWEFU|nr:unnamed protein product [Owenia fusiformis]
MLANYSEKTQTTNMQQYLKIVLSLILLLWIMMMVTHMSMSQRFLIVQLQPNITKTKTKPEIAPAQRTRNFTKPFLYIINVKQCVAEHLTVADMLGNPETLDVLVMSYGSPCNNAKRELRHFVYSYAPNTTWTSGRNAAWSYTQKHFEQYKYYIFMDEDCVLQTTMSRMLDINVLEKIRTLNMPILRQFELFLLETQPAVAAPFHADNASVFIRDILLCCPGHDNPNKLWNLPERIPMNKFDPIFAAFHCQAIKYIMPLITQFDTKNWWIAGHYLHLKSYYYFHRQLVRYTPMTVINPMHTNYPKFGGPSDVDLIKIIQSEVPDAVKNATRFTDDARRCLSPRYFTVHPLMPSFELAEINDTIEPFKYI